MVPPTYGVTEQTASHGDVDLAAERVRLAGYCLVPSGLTEAQLKAVSGAFDRTLATVRDRYPDLSALGENNIIRAALRLDPAFRDLALNEAVHGLVRKLLGEFDVLNQQNGLCNPPVGEDYEQAAFHRDLSYQHVVSSRPLAVSALFCIDPFTQENGATLLIPGSHHQEAFPAEGNVARLAAAVEAPAGTFIVFDSLCFHGGGRNGTDLPRRAVNHVFSIPPIQQQIRLPQVLGADYPRSVFERRLFGYDIDAPDSIEAYYRRLQSRRNAPR